MKIKNAQENVSHRDAGSRLSTGTLRTKMHWDPLSVSMVC